MKKWVKDKISNITCQRLIEFLEKVHLIIDLFLNSWRVWVYTGAGVAASRAVAVWQNSETEQFDEFVNATSTPTQSPGEAPRLQLE